MAPIEQLPLFGEEVDLVVFGRELKRLMSASFARGEVLYAILCRNAGWAFQWYDDALRNAKRPARGYTVEQDGLTVYGYHDTLQGAIRAELKRLEASA